jgi:hypothetical protein
MNAAGSTYPDVPLRFYNRPDATDAMKAAELAHCRVIAAGPGAAVEPQALTPPTEQLPSFPRTAAVPDISVEACMVTRGWRVYQLSARERESLARLRPSARRQALATLTGARQPAHGKLVSDGSVFQLPNPGVR